MVPALLVLSAFCGAQPAPGTSENLAANRDTARQIRREFLHAWKGYRRYAWGHDELKPLSRTAHDWYSSPLYMTAVDALDTMILMGLDREAAETRTFLDKNLSFDHDMYVKNFEITIRLLGGLLSSYQLTRDPRQLDLARDLGNRLLPAFNSPTGMPYRFVNLKTGAVRDAVSNPAEIGSLLLEFGTLSKLTGDPVFYEKAKRALVELYNRRSPIGLVGSAINVETGEWTDPTSHISGGIDSYDEYLLKCWLLFGDEDCYRMWQSSITAINKYVADQQPQGLWYAQVNMNTGKVISRRFGALDAFFPGTLALSGDLDRARRLLESSFKMWNTYGVEPDEIDYTTMKATDAAYPLRPEIIESTYYLYHFTGRPKYLDMGRVYLGGLKKYCRTRAGYAALSDVTRKTQADEMPSYFFAETLKYLYLLFAPSQALDLSKSVFNTEAHPLQRTW